MRSSIVGAVALNVWLASGAARPLTAAEAAPHALVDKAAPPFSFQDVRGRSVSLSAFRGKVVVVDLWATWCEPCVRGMPEMRVLARSYGGQGVVFLAVDQGEDADSVREFVDQKKLGAPLRFGIDPEEKVGAALGAEGLPHTVVIDRAGVVRAVHSGYSSSLMKELRGTIDRALERKPKS